ncbi:hypothetical protein [Reyranella sp.]|uniref:hypothetical protein n=1 Tax=Reyranella sp. TaxID=1929291 RepID=UPI001214D780|nr:hypothetical protein [Reyranella sp.]TAJ89706.1 MAG: hypothetical protein EPO50_04905 [Reyranella sp.]
MPVRPHRVRNTHRATVCGLVICGLNYRDACTIAGIAYKEMREHLPHNWWCRNPARRVDDHTWAQIRAAYESSKEPVDALCARYGIGQKTLYRRIEKGGWTQRGAGKPKNAISISRLPTQRRTFYHKLRSIGVPYDEALRQALA